MMSSKEQFNSIEEELLHLREENFSNAQKELELLELLAVKEKEVEFLESDLDKASEQLKQYKHKLESLQLSYDKISSRQGSNAIISNQELNRVCQEKDELIKKLEELSLQTRALECENTELKNQERQKDLDISRLNDEIVRYQTEYKNLKRQLEITYLSSLEYDKLREENVELNIELETYRNLFRGVEPKDMMKELEARNEGSTEKYYMKSPKDLVAEILSITTYTALSKGRPLSRLRKSKKSSRSMSKLTSCKPSQ